MVWYGVVSSFRTELAEGLFGVPALFGGREPMVAVENHRYLSRRAAPQQSFT